MLSHVIANLRQRLSDANVSAQLLLGRRHLRQHGNATPTTAPDGGGRIVVIPDEDNYGAGRTQGLNDNPRTLTTRTCGAEVHFWAGAAPDAHDKDLDAMAKTESLLHVFVREFRAIARGHYTVGPGRWNNDPPETHLYGVEYVLRITVDVPVTDLPNVPIPKTNLQTTFSMGNSSEVG